MKQPQKATKKSSRRRTRQQILQLLKDFDKRKLAISQFCELHHIHPSSFHLWRKRYGSAHTQSANSNGFLAVELTAPDAPHQPALFAEVNGIRVYQPVSAIYLKTLLP